ncbi:hypothetical protein ACU686_31125 [Yinghuangia aomiensis]
MHDRGYPTEERTVRMDILSVVYSRHLDRYRQAHEIERLGAAGKASTEDLRQALLHHRTLFDDLLGRAPDATSPSRGAGRPATATDKSAEAKPVIERDDRDAAARQARVSEKTGSALKPPPVIPLPGQVDGRTLLFVLRSIIRRQWDRGCGRAARPRCSPNRPPTSTAGGSGMNLARASWTARPTRSPGRMSCSRRPWTGSPRR